MADQNDANVVLTADTSQYQQSMGAAEKSTQGVLSSVLALSAAMSRLTTSTGRKIEIVGVGQVAALTAMGKASADLESRMTQLRASSEITGKSFSAMGKDVQDLRRNFALSRDEVIALYTQLNRLGQSTTNMRQLSDTFIRLGAVTGESIDGLVDGLIQLQRQMGTVGSGYTQQFAANLANISQKAGVSATSVLQFSNAIAPVGKVAGMTTNEILGVSTAFSKAGADGYQAATAFNRMLTDITRATQYGSPELKAYSNLIGVTVDQFKAMPKADAVSRIFEQINKQGPDAIKTLEQFGLDGIRTYRSLQAVASQGGISDAVNQTLDPQNAQKFMNASNAALHDFNNSMSELKNTAQTTAESLGSGFLPIMQKLADAANVVMHAIGGIVDMMGKVPGIAGAASAGMTMLSGAALLALPKLLGIASAAVAARNPLTLGFAAGRTGNDNIGTLRATAADDAGRYIAGAGQRGLYTAGTWLGGGYGALRAAMGPGNGGPNTLSRLTAMGVHGAGELVRMGLAPLFPDNIRDPFNREHLLPSEASRQDWLDRQGQAIRGGAGRVAGAAGNLRDRFMTSNVIGVSETAQAAAAARLAAAQTAAATATAEQTAAATTVNGAFRQLSVETARLGMNIARAGAGTAVGAGMGVSRLATTGIGRAIGAFGGMNLALMGGMAGYSLWQRENQMADERANTGEDTSAGAKYRQALGEASIATMSFADAVKQAADRTRRDTGGLSMGQALRVSTADANAPTTAAYTDNAIQGMNQAQATAYASNMIGNSTPNDVNLLKRDLLKRFGDPGVVQQILSQASTNPGQMGPLFDRIFSEQNTPVLTGLGLDVFTRGGAQDAAKTASGSLKAAINNAPADQRANVMAGGINQALASIWRNPGMQGMGITTDALADALGAGDPASRKAIYDAVRGAKSRANNAGQFGRPNTLGDWQPTILDQIAGSDTTAGSAIKTMMDQLRAQAAHRGVPLNQLLQSMTIGPASVTHTGGLDTSIYSATSAQSNIAGAMVLGDNRNLNYAYRSPADANAQQQASEEMVSRLTSMTGSMDGAIQALADLKNSGISASDRLYQMAAAAEQYARHVQDQQMHYMSQGEQAGVLNQRYVRSREIAVNNPSDTNAQQQLMADQDAREQARASLYDKAMGILYARRELGVSQSRGQEDLARTQQYAWDDFQRQREYGEQDFQRERQRGEDDYTRQRKYAEADYQRNRTWAIQSFNRSRARNEEDYNHQVVLMAKQTAQQIYDIYQRVTVQQTWSAQALFMNLMDQQKRMMEQQSQLTRLRGMGVSGDVIQMLGLNQATGAQQLGRFLDDVLADPSLVAKYNKAAQDRTALAGKFATDKDNQQWQEMQRQHELGVKRSQEDFEISLSQQNTTFREGMRRQAESYGIALSRSESDFNRARDRQLEQYGISIDRMNEQFSLQFKRANEDLNRQATEITGTWGDVTTRAMSTLSGLAKKQMDATRRNLADTADDVKGVAGHLITDLQGLFAKIGIQINVNSNGGTATSAGGGRVTGSRVMVNGKWENIGQMAGGGEVRGSSVHSREDNIPAMLTAREFVQPVDTVSHYGVDVMKAIQNRAIPKEILRGYSKGGLVDFGHYLQGRGYAVSEHPLFGGVHPVHAKNSWHYRAGAIDVNADNFKIGEKAAIDQIVGLARQYGLRTLWQIAGHFNHAHFDIGAGADMLGPGYHKTSGAGGNISSLSYNDLLTKLIAMPSMRQFNKAVGQSPITSVLGNNLLAAAIATTYAAQGPQDYSGVANGPVRQMAQQMAAVKGWRGGQWNALDYIVNHESGWNPAAQNPGSTAYGLFQFLDSTWGAMGGRKTSDPRTQIELGLKYISNRYGDPKHAQDFWKQHHWYGEGSVFSGPTTIGVGEHGAEAVFPLNERGAEFLLGLMRKTMGADFHAASHAPNSAPVRSQQINYYSKVDKSNHFHGDIAVKAENPYELIRKLDEKKRMEQLTGGKN